MKEKIIGKNDKEKINEAYSDIMKIINNLDLAEDESVTINEELRIKEILKKLRLT